jgi:hypothetical protein
VTEANFKYKTRTRVTRRIIINEDKDESEKKRKDSAEQLQYKFSGHSGQPKPVNETR